MIRLVPDNSNAAITMSGKLKVGIVGASLRGLWLGELMERNTDTVVVGVADPQADALARARETSAGDDVVYAPSDRELYEKCDCDAVIIASGDPYHVANAEVAVEFGKHVFLEKPVAQTMPELKRLSELWRSTDRVMMVGLELRQCILFREMRRMLDEGAIGRVIVGQAFDNVSVGGQYFFHNHYRKRSHTRSLLLQKGAHTIDLLNWFMGAQPTRAFCTAGQNVYGISRPAGKRCRDCEQVHTCPNAVREAQIMTDYAGAVGIDDLCVYAEGADVDDNSLVLIDYENGGRAFYGECHFTPEYTREFTLIGDGGKMTGFYNKECEFKITLRRLGESGQPKVFEPRPEVVGGHGGSDVLAMREFHRRVIERDRAPDEFRQVMDGAAIAIAATDSSETGQPVDIPSWA